MPISHRAAGTRANLRRLSKPLVADAYSRPPLRKTEAVLFGMFVYDGFGVPGLPVVIPGSDLAAIALVGISVFRRPQHGPGGSKWLIPFAIILLTYLAFSSMYNDVDWFRRLFRITIMFAFVASIISGRLDLSSGLKGLGVALAINAGLFYTGIAPNNYAGALTGFLGDKNVAGLYYCIIPLLIMAEANRKNEKFAWALFGAGAVFLTGSRTALAAYACALAWIAIAGLGGRFFRFALMSLFALGLHYLERYFAQAWIFADRAGSDLLRERINNAAMEKAELSSWNGLGLGESYVMIDNHRWFFHDSYLALYAEGGWVMLISVVLLYVQVGLRPFSPFRGTKHELFVEATTIALLICALKLGEVFLSLPGFIVIAYGMRVTMHTSDLRSPLRGVRI